MAAPWRIALATTLLVVALGLDASRGGDAELWIPVDYARVTLPARAPLTLDLDLPAGEWFVQPASLGYFSGAGQFVYTAEEPRGLIYGRDGERVIAVELATPSSADDFMADYLDRIRRQVAVVNAAENELLLARQRFAGQSGRVKQLASIPMGLSSAELAAGALDDWCASCFAEPGVAEGAPRAVAQSCQERGELKRMYYDAQLARVELALRNFDLQMALARMPTPTFADVLGPGDQRLVSDTALRNLHEMLASWEARRGELKRQRELDRAQLSVPAELVLPPHTPSLRVLSASSEPYLPPALDPAQSLRRNVLEQRLLLADSELRCIDAACTQMAEALTYIQAGGLTDGGALPKLAVDADEFAPVRVASLPKLAVVEAFSARPLVASGVLLDLAQLFEQPDAPAQLTLPGESGVLSVDCAPQELAYGLLVVDRCRRVETAEDGRPDGAVLVERLEQILASPAEYEAAESDLGLLAFLRWYAEQVPLTAPSSGSVAQRIQTSAAAVGERLRQDAH